MSDHHPAPSQRPHPPPAAEISSHPDLGGSSGQAWEQQPKESNLWFDRFATYRDLGPTRTIDAAFRIIATKEQLTAKRPGSNWYANAHHWTWNERASAWDAEQRRLIRTQETDRRLHARETRLDMTTSLLRHIYDHMTPAWLEELTPMQLRLFFLSLLSAYRNELPPPLYDPGASDPIEFTADELSTAYAQLQAWRADQELLSDTWTAVAVSDDAVSDKHES